MSLTICERCRKKECLDIQRPCKRLEELLRRRGIYSANYIRPKRSTQQAREDNLGQWREINVKNIDEVAVNRAYELKYGKLKKKGRED